MPQALDNVTAGIAILDARVGTPITHGTLTIDVRACQAWPPEEVPDAAAWTEITDSRARPGSAPAFRDSMFANAPSVSMSEPPIYDIRVLSAAEKRI